MNLDAPELLELTKQMADAEKQLLSLLTPEAREQCDRLMELRDTDGRGGD